MPSIDIIPTSVPVTIVIVIYVVVIRVRRFRFGPVDVSFFDRGPTA